MAAVGRVVSLSLIHISNFALILNDKQGVAAKAVNVLVAPLEAGGKVIEDKGKVRHVAVSYTHLDVYKRQSHSGVSLPLVRSFRSGFLHIPAKSHGATSPGKHIPHRLVIRLE